MDLRIGDLRHRLSIEAPVRNDDGLGGSDAAWAEMAVVWAAVRPISGSERERADQFAGRLTHEIWIRYRDDIRPEMRFRFTARTFEIRAVIDPGERRRFLKCLCEEREL